MTRSLAPWATAAWLIILTVISVRVILRPQTHSVFPIFAEAGRCWLAGEDIYGRQIVNLDQFRYSPAVAAAFAPWSFLPPCAGEVLWRWVNAAAFFGGLALSCRWLWSDSSKFSAAALVVVPLAVGSLNNGQCNPLATGLL